MKRLPMEYEYVSMHQKTIARDVANFRQADRVRAGKVRNTRYRMTLVRTGALLTRVGNYLQERYGEIKAQPEPSRATHFKPSANCL